MVICDFIHPFTKIWNNRHINQSIQEEFYLLGKFSQHFPKSYNRSGNPQHAFKNGIRIQIEDFTKIPSDQIKLHKSWCCHGDC